jgi:hypothetical protein
MLTLRGSLSFYVTGELTGETCQEISRALLPVVDQGLKGSRVNATSFGFYAENPVFKGSSRSHINMSQSGSISVMHS